MSPRPHADQLIASQLQYWHTHDLEDLTKAIAALIASRQQQAEPQQGYIEIKSIPHKKTGKSYGAYRYLRYRNGTKLRSIYLGKVPAEEASSS